MVKNFIPNCDMCGQEIPFEKYSKRTVPANGVELLMIALENADPDLEFTQNADGTVDLDTCQDCYTRIAFRYSQSVN